MDGEREREGDRETGGAWRERWIKSLRGRGRNQDREKDG